MKPFQFIFFSLILFLGSCANLNIPDSGRIPLSRHDLTCHGITRFFLVDDSDQIPPQFLKLTQNELDDTAMEIELKRSNKMLALMDTEDGTLLPLFQNSLMPEDLQLPQNIKNQIRSLGLGHAREDMLDVRFSQLPHDLKTKILKFQGAHRLGDFQSSRLVPGLKMKSVVELTFDKKTTFLGTRYQAGTHQVDITPLIEKTVVEYKGPGSVTNFGGVEIHLRSGAFTSGDFTLEVWKFLKAAGLDKDRGHAHVVTQFDLDQLRENPITQAALMTDYWRRANIVAEFISIIDKGVSVRTVRNETSIYFRPTEAHQVEQTFAFLKRLGEADDWRSVPFGDRAKMGYVGFHGPDKYDADVPVIGYQFRTLSGKRKITFRDYLNLIQKQMREHTFGSMNSSKMDNWLGDRRNSNGRIKDAFRNNWIHRTREDFMNTLHPELSEKLSEDSFANAFFSHADRNQELHLLVHNWSDDPLLYGNEEAISRVVQAQLAALDKITANSTDEELKVAAQDFLEESGLYKSFFASLGGNLQ